jgi:GntR family transcriptional repressor for pyruvate dehydrogenase complex
MSKTPVPNDEQRGTSSNIAATICRELRGRILSGKLAPGERLPGERELAQRYDTNRNTLREAVRMLEQARLVSVRHGQGVTVSDFRRTGTLELLPAFLENASNVEEVMLVLGDILPARLMVLEFAARVAARRAQSSDLERLRQVTAVLIGAFERSDAVVVAHEFVRWLDALVDAGHSVAVRWIANPFLEAYRELMDRFPALWVLEPTFPQHLRELIPAIEAREEERAVQVLRAYYERVDANLTRMITGIFRPSAASGG